MMSLVAPENDNLFIEHFWRTVKYEQVDPHAYDAWH